MKRRDLDYVVITLLVGSSIYVFLTGLIADTMGLHHFGFHSQVGYLWISLAVIHLVQTWVRVKAYANNRFRARVPATPTAERVSTADAHPVSSADSNLNTAPPQNRFRPGGSGRRNIVLVILAIATGIGFHHLVTSDETVGLGESENDIGLLYHRWSQPGYGETIATILNWGQQPPRYKTYPDAPQIDLPLPAFAASDVTGSPTVDVVEAMMMRRSRRNYDTSSVLSLAKLSQLLYLAQGITEGDRDFRAVPSSGALYPLELYPIVHRVAGLEPGLYHHAIQHHKLELVKPGDLRQPLVKAGLNQEFLGEASVCFVVSGIFQRTRWKYHERTYRYVLMESGHLGQNLYLAATALGLGVCGIGAFFDDPLNQLLEIDGQEEATLYLITAGELA